MEEITSNQKPQPELLPEKRKIIIPESAKKGFKALIMDIIPVIIGILIALYINDLKAGYDDNKMTEETIQGLLSEFRENTKELDKAVTSQTKYLDSLKKYLENDSVTIIKVTSKTHGFWIADLADVSWQTYLGSNGVRNLSFECKSLLGKINAYTKFLDERKQVLSLALYNPQNMKISEEQYYIKQGLLLLMTDTIDNQEVLKRLYSDFEKMIKNKKYKR